MKKNKNNIDQLSHILRYIKGEISGRKRNQLERARQKDLFLDQAFEGFESIAPDDLSDDIQELQRSLKRRTRTSGTYYRIAASVAVLMAISSVILLIVTQRPSGEMVSDNIEFIEITREEPLTRSSQQSSVPLLENAHDKTVVPGRRSVTEPKETLSPVTHDDNPSVPEVPGSDKAESGRTEETTESKTDFEHKPQTATELSESLRAAAPEKMIRRSIDDTGGTVVLDCSLKKGKDHESYTPPVPSGGKDTFVRYISENLRRPASMLTGEQVAVITEFRVKADGSVDSIKVTSSPGKMFSDEAIRIIKQGPLWMPAMKNGKPVDDKVSIRIEFR
jgi:outer membrane biosynthesis protein TonB